MIGAVVMALGGLAEILFGVHAEQKSLESIAEPLSAESGADAPADSDRAQAEPKPQSPARPSRIPGRFRPGVGTSRAYSPLLLISDGAPSERELQREVDLIVGVLGEHGQLERSTLARAVGARFWGPGQMSLALAEAVRRGLVRQKSRRMFALAEGTTPAPRDASHSA